MCVSESIFRNKVVASNNVKQNGPLTAFMLQSEHYVANGKS